MGIEMDPTYKWVFIGVAVVAFIVMNVCIAVCCYCCTKKKRGKRNTMKEMVEAGYKKSGNEYSKIAIPAPSSSKARPASTMEPGKLPRRESNLESALRQALLNRAQTIMLDSSRLTIGEALGNGHFGVVFKAQLKSKDGKRSETVAVKTVLEGTDVEDMTQFLEEAFRMRGFAHEHVLSMMGIVDRDGRPYVVLPYMANGDLKGYLADEKRTFSITDLLWLALQVAEGMVYLASSNFVHRDLAARNCMVSDEGIIKVADFGLSCDLFDDDYYRTEGESKPLPAKWMAPECFSEKVFSEKSDVWSYGVLLWEIFTRGMVPYSGKKHREVIDFVTHGGRLACPEHCPNEIYSIMCKCWRRSPTERPKFDDIRLMLNLLLGGKIKNKKKNVSVPNQPTYVNEIV